jgi:hypothetical protein
MSKAIVALMAVLAFTALTTMPVQAQGGGSPKILEQFTRVTETATSLTVSGKASGLAGGHTYTVVLSGTVSGTAQCVNPGGNNPPPKGFSINVTASGDFTAARNGNLTFTVTQPISSIEAADCPNPNWSVLVTYSGTIDISLFDGTMLLDTQEDVAVIFP